MSCIYPGCTRPVYPGSSFCGKTHRDNYANATANNTSSGGKTCVYPGCTRPVFTGSSFCSISHRDDAPNRGCAKCLWCRSKARNVLYPSLFCSKTCGVAANAAAPILLQLDQNDPKYPSVVNQFTQKWLHKPGAAPPIKYIYVILNTPQYISRYKNYRANLEANGQFKSKGMTEGNERRRFHGTKRDCTVGDNGNRTMCNSASCALCSIMKTSFAIFKVAKNWGRFGNGIYTSSTSSKANDYQANLRGQSSFKAMILAKVACGQVKKLYKDDTTLTAPPAGFNSVIGEPGTATQQSTVNYDELIVYTEDAVIPAYLIIYQ